MMLGVLVSCIFFAGQQNSNTPAPHSAHFFFNLTFLIFDIGVNKQTRKAYPQDMWVANSLSPDISIYFKLDPASTSKQESAPLVPLFWPPTSVGYINFIHMIIGTNLWLFDDRHSGLSLLTCLYSSALDQYPGIIGNTAWRCFVLFCLLINFWGEAEFPSFNYPIDIPLSLHNSNWRGSGQLYYQIRKMKGLQSG